MTIPNIGSLDPGTHGSYRDEMVFIQMKLKLIFQNLRIIVIHLFHQNFIVIIFP